MNISLLDIFSVKLESPHLFKGTIRIFFFFLLSLLQQKLLWTIPYFLNQIPP